MLLIGKNGIHGRRYDHLILNCEFIPSLEKKKKNNDQYKSEAQ